MAEKLASLRKKGGGDTSEPLVVFVRGRTYEQFVLKNDLIKKYKYIKVMTGTEYTNYVSPSAPVVPVEYYTSSVPISLNHNGSSYGSTITLTTTPVSVSSLGLDDGKMCLFDARATDAMYVIELYN